MRLTILKVGQNRKLGKNVATWSRPVGPSCPNTCPFLHTACYAEKMQTFRPNVAKSWAAQGGAREYWGDWARQFKRELEWVAAKGLVVRGHVAGDFMLDGERLDRPYMAAVLWAFRRASPRPAAWLYTHAWRHLGASKRESLRRAGIQAFASVHNRLEALQAHSLGYRLAIDRGLTVKAGQAQPAWTENPWVGMDEQDMSLPVMSMQCPEQRCGSNAITCSACRFCFRPERREAVIFDRH